MKYLRFLVILCFGCGGGGVNNAFEAELADSFNPEMIADEAPGMIKQDPQFTRKIIKTGNITFQSDDVEKDYQDISGLLVRYESYIEYENQTKSVDQIRYNVTLRVVAGNFDSLFNAILAIPDKIEQKSVNAEDATERYYDLELRIKNKKALEKRYLELVEQASTISDILEVENKLNEVRTEIESLQGQFNYLSKRINYSTIHLAFYEVLPYTYDTVARPGFTARIFSALDNGWQGFLTFLVGLTSLWPFILLLIGIIYASHKFGWSFRRRKKKQVPNS